MPTTDSTGPEEVLAGGFNIGRVFITDSTFKGKKKIWKWSDTSMRGILKLVKVKRLGGAPVVHVRLYGTDDLYQVVQNVILEYELPTNFKFDSALAETFSTIHIMQGQYLGFLFMNATDRKVWDT